MTATDCKLDYHGDVNVLLNQTRVYTIYSRLNIMWPHNLIGVTDVVTL